MIVAAIVLAVVAAVVGYLSRRRPPTPVDLKAPYHKSLINIMGMAGGYAAETWRDRFRVLTGRPYKEANLGTSQQVSRSPGLGFDKPISGNCYYPTEERVLLDQNFLQAIDEIDHNGAQNAEFLVAAHMFGHHIMHLLDPNLDAKVLKLRQDHDFQNPWLEQYEYQADYLAGVCLARRGKKAFNEADLRAAADLVDKAAKKMAAKSTDAVAVPDPLTHGTPELRLKWMIKGFEGGQIKNRGPLYVRDFRNP